jgi:GTP-binding protein
MLLHLVDAAGEDPGAAWRTVREEMGRYGAALDEKTELLALSRCDLVDARQLKKARQSLDKAGAPEPLAISAATGDGVEALLDRIIESLGPEAEAAEPEDGADRAWSPL